MKVKKSIQTLLLAMCAGFCVSIGCMVYLSVESKVLGAFLFNLGLFAILLFQFNLYTGKVGYLLYNKPKYILDVITIWIGNFCGVYLFSQLSLATRIGATLKEKSEKIAQVKLGDSNLSLFLLAVFCGLLMFIAVDSYKTYVEKKDTILCVIIILCIVVFILAGFEHCIANIFYFSITGTLSEGMIPLLVVTIGNGVGGNMIPIVKKINAKLEA